MKKLIILSCVILFSSYVKAQTDCSMYHKGYFTYTDSVGNTILVKRGNKYQYEYNRKIKVKTQFRINWNNDCEYTITQAITNSKSLKKNKNSVTGVSISKADGANGYYYTCNCKGEIIKGSEGFMKKITKDEFYQLY